MTLVDGCAVVLRGAADVLPVAALPHLRGAAHVFGVDEQAPAPELLVKLARSESVVLVAASAHDPAAAALVAEGAPVVGLPVGAGLLDAVAVMDRLRSPGGCPWDAEQDHDTLRQYLVEETFELLEAIEDGDRAAMREELGDVLLQVLFHARVAAEHDSDAFTVDDVAAELVAKLVGRHPHVFAGGDAKVKDSSTQQLRWEELKQAEKQRESSVDGVALGQPAVALAAKLVQRTKRAGLPADLLPGWDAASGAGTAQAGGGDSGTALFAVAASAKLAGEDPETGLRAVARTFAAHVRAAETAARLEGITTLTSDDWRRFWPANVEV
ncbi:MazG family protein [Umezawaea tangerina]|uniref:XTP/dITP diphosphohydrolase n=1 Tax=Umezawaea tangerina TaxID=84725 RepID=A0A2T0TLR1_9PSEU|nr:MazG family protein [Umezawaea tangerina]PRY46654.1 XTP/dITP diphosphohydrolase [Umezawaea tangerina]